MKTVRELEQAIRDIITNLYCVTYTGKLNVVETFDNSFPGDAPIHLGYIVKIGLNKDERPIELAMEGSDVSLLSYIKKELKERSFHRTKYFTAIQLYEKE